ncbi:hypothetical protein [Nocardiopsis prasina]|uniref:hypothetical protein n=1 Tax=Nocardiopsis prasina TaxID=2015 RepID=UPI0003464B80|nr:hypothetical protein [Nocardiopsis prasina]
MSGEGNNERDGGDERSSGTGASDEEQGAAKKSWRHMSREEVMQRFDGYQAKQRANRRRLTGDDVQEMLRERRAERQQRRRERSERGVSGRGRPRDVGRSVRLSLGSALMLGALAAGYLAAASTDTTEAQSEANEQSIASLKGDIRLLEAQTQEEPDVADLEERLGQALEDAQTKGEQVARAQNEYQEILVDLDDEDLAEGRETDDAHEQRKELVDLFDESARVIKDEDSHHPGAHVIHGPREIDVLDPWYSRHADETRTDYADPTLNSWELVSTTPRTGSASVVDVAWLNRDASTGDVLAWARGTFSGDTGRFHSLQVGRTSIGERPADAAREED